MRKFVLGVLVGMIIQAGIAGAYLWDSDRSTEGNYNEMTEETQRQEMIDQEYQQQYNQRYYKPC